MNVKVLYDYQAFNDALFGGVSNSFSKLISHMPDKVEWKIGIKECENHHLLHDLPSVEVKPMSCTAGNFLMKKHFPGKRTLFKYIDKNIPFFPSSRRINMAASIKEIKKGDFDVFHPTFFDDYFLKYIGSKPFVLTVHDMMPEIFPEYYKNDRFQIEMKKKLCPLAAHIICVSNQTKHDLIDILNVPEEKITVIYHGAPETAKTLGGDKAIVEGRYFLYIGRRGRENGTYKNFVQSAREFARFVEKTGNKDIKYVCTASPFDAEEKQLFESLQIADRMVHVDADDAKIMNLYKNALAFVYPSLYEGFGIPILEAYEADCPVMLNNKSCFPEIAGDAAEYFVLDSHKQNLAEAMERMTTMTKQQREDLLERQRKRLAMFSWHTSARQLADVYEKVIKNRAALC